MVKLKKFTNLRRGKENKSMLYDLTFEEAMDILKNRIGWVQGERQIGCVFDFWGDQTK